MTSSTRSSNESNSIETGTTTITNNNTTVLTSINNLNEIKVKVGDMNINEMNEATFMSPNNVTSLSSSSIVKNSSLMSSGVSSISSEQSSSSAVSIASSSISSTNKNFIIIKNSTPVEKYSQLEQV